jgi:hypothetical protein
MRTSLRFVGASVAGAILLACGGATLIGPENELQVSNDTDRFEWQASMLENVTQTLSYKWQNTGTSANVDQSSSINSGTATLTIWCVNGNEMYSGPLTQDGTFETTVGQSGEWTFEVVLVGVHGTVNFRVDAP